VLAITCHLTLTRVNTVTIYRSCFCQVKRLLQVCTFSIHLAGFISLFCRLEIEKIKGRTICFVICFPALAVSFLVGSPNVIKVRLELPVHDSLLRGTFIFCVFQHFIILFRLPPLMCAKEAQEDQETQC